MNLEKGGSVVQNTAPTNDSSEILLTPRWRSKQGVCSVSCGGGVADRVLYCAREAEEGEEVVVEDSECSDFLKPTGVVSCNTHSCPAR